MALDERMGAELAQELADNNRELVIDPRKVPVRFSRLRQLSRSALHYWHSVQEDKNENDTAARRLGRAAHAVALGGARIALFGPGTFNGKAYKGVKNGAYWENFKKENKGKEIVTAKELAKATAMARAIEKHPKVRDMLYSGGTQLEHEVDWTWQDRACQSHFDAYRKGDFVADVKTARDGEPGRFAWAAIKSGYHAQLAYYVEACERLGHPTPEPFIIVVENAPPYPVTLMHITPKALEAGRRQCRLWFEQLLGYEAANEWPAYTDNTVELDVPDDFDERFVVAPDDDDEDDESDS
jgi:PDDEXK-like uncharacterized protein DUF3799